MDNKCPICDKKLKLTNLICKCNIIYCNLHTPPEMHNCSFDYKKLGKQLLEKKNPKILTEKLIKI